MTLCLQPACLKGNPDHHKFCQHCGKPLLLRERYQALQLLGQGGFGKTFIAVDHDKPSKPKCVIKQCLPQVEGTDGLEKAEVLFAEEAKHLEQLGHHAQIPALYAHFTVEGQQYLVQEYVQGQTLTQELETEGVFSQAKIEQVLRDLLPVLDFIHRIPVIHRDIKPDNIIRRESDRRLVLVDFGAAKRVISDATGTIIGTPEYVAPEQMAGKPKAASDIYSLGVTCLHLLTGVSPFDLFDTGEFTWVWRDYLVDNPVDDELGAVLEKMVCQGTKNRYQSATEVLRALEMLSQTKPQVSVKKLSNLQKKSQLTSKKILPQPTIIQLAQPKISPSGQVLGEYEETIINGSLFGLGKKSIEIIVLSAGSFMMGSIESNSQAFTDEKPQHLVNVKEFAISKYPITQIQYKTIMKSKSSEFKSQDAHCPVTHVSWHDAKNFCEKLSQQTGIKYRLPSEAEWEYACRAGTETLYFFGDNKDALMDYAWFRRNSEYRTHPVGKKRPNEWGLYDMHGNVSEWCEDSWYCNYEKARTDSYPWIQKNENLKVIRGGGWYEYPRRCRSAYRSQGGSNLRSAHIGFRIACSPLTMFKLLEYIINEQGQKIGVLLDLESYSQLVQYKNLDGDI